MRRLQRSGESRYTPLKRSTRDRRIVSKSHPLRSLRLQDQPLREIDKDTRSEFSEVPSTVIHAINQIQLTKSLGTGIEEDILIDCLVKSEGCFVKCLREEES